MGFGKFCNLLSYLFNWVFQGNSLSIHLTAILTSMILDLCFFLMMFYGFDPMGFITMVHHHLGEYFWMCFFPTTEEANSKWIDESLSCSSRDWWIKQFACVLPEMPSIVSFFFGEFATLPKSKSFTGKKCLILLMVQKSQLTHLRCIPNPVNKWYIYTIYQLVSWSRISSIHQQTVSKTLLGPLVFWKIIE